MTTSDTQAGTSHSPPILFLHGFLSSAQGSNARYLSDKLADFPDVFFHALEFNSTPRDFEFMTVTGSSNRLTPLFRSGSHSSRSTPTIG